VKNSWGPDWGDKGYFYISYYDSYAGNGSSIFTAENLDNYEYIYQYDPFGWVTSLGYTNPIGWCANVFTANSEEVLKAVSFYTTDSNSNYEIYIYTNLSSGPTNQAGPVFSKNGTCLTAGYHTIPLDSEVRLNAGQKFSVVLKLTNPAYRYTIALEKPKDNWSSKARANSGESFISTVGSPGQMSTRLIQIQTYASRLLQTMFCFLSQSSAAMLLRVTFPFLCSSTIYRNSPQEETGTLKTMDT
jgi:hypothetical protein